MISNDLKNTILKKKATDKTIKRPLTKEERKERIKQWCTFYRRNPEIYAEQVLGVNLRPFQKFWIHIMMRSQMFFAVASRGSAKTFLAGLMAVIECMLYPYSEVVITASTIEQSKKIIDVKIKKEIFGKLSPTLRYLEQQGLIVIKTSKDEARVDFLFNGSTIKVLPALDSSRGERATTVIFEECRLLKQGDIQSIFRPMLHPRQAKFMQLDKYSGNSLYYSDGRELYQTSSRYANEPWYRTAKRVIEQSYKSVGIIYDFIMVDVFTSIKWGLKTQKEWEKIQQTSNELDIRAEYLNEVIGEAENAYFPLELVSDCQSIRKAFRPTRNSDISRGNIPKNREKASNEYRVIGIDFAFASTTGAEDNDNTVIECVSGVYKDGEIIRSLEYTETLSGSKQEETLKRIRELAEDYKADYIVLDARSGGETYMTNLSKPYEHPTRSNASWDNHGYTVVLDTSLQYATDAKVNEVYSRKIDPDAKQMIIPILANIDFNSEMWISLHQCMQAGKIKMLIDSSKMEFERAESKDWLKLSSEERMFEKLPYVQNDFLVVEAINLKQEIRDGRIKLSEPRSGTKDRVVVLAYVNMFFNKLEEKLNRQNQREDDDWDDNLASLLWL